MRKKTLGVIAAGNQKTVEAGKIMFELGGNAFDAAIAGILASFVVESPLTSAGGGGFLLAHTQSNTSILFDFFCQTPYRKKPPQELNFYGIDVDFGVTTQEFHIGRGSIAVPGNVAGLFKIHKKLGKLPFDLIAEPAINYAKNGFIVSEYNDYCYQLLAPIFLENSESRKVYAPENKLLEKGEICYMKDFADALRELVEQGEESFYRGDLAHQMLKDLAEGGYLTAEDLAHYQVIPRKPLRLQYRGYEILTNPPPSSGGILIAFALKLLETYDLKGVNYESKNHLQILAQVMALTNQARQKNYDNYLYEQDIMERFLSQKSLQKYQDNLQNTINKWGSTTQVSVMDEDGNAASATTSNGEGSSYVIPHTGIMLNNMLGEADLNPLGFHQWPENQRISSMMSPTIILQEGKPKFVLGSGGSNRIRTAILQVIFNLIDLDLSVAEAVNRARIHWENNVLNIEPFEGREDIFKDLHLPELTEVVFWEQKNMFFGGVHTVGETEIGQLEGAGDPRREGFSG